MLEKAHRDASDKTGLRLLGQLPDTANILLSNILGLNFFLKSEPTVTATSTIVCRIFLGQCEPIAIIVGEVNTCNSDNMFTLTPVGEGCEVLQ